MLLDVCYKKNSNSNSTQLKIPMNGLAFAKHFAIAGQYYEPKITKIPRILGIFLMYSLYLERDAFCNENRFSEPRPEFSDPTQKSQFSNLAGRAIADFLSKRIDNCCFTVNYEAAMRRENLQIKGKRADLIGFTSNGEKISIEAKGFSTSSISEEKMKKYKTQAQEGGLHCKYSVACVSYNLYNRVKCNYYDPEGEDNEFDKELLKELTKNYYSGLKRFLELGVEYQIKEFSSEEFYVINLRKIALKIFFKYESYRDFDFFAYEFLYSYYLILPKKIDVYSESGLDNSLEPFEKFLEHDDIYIDNDRVGLCNIKAIEKQS